MSTTAQDVRRESSETEVLKELQAANRQAEDLLRTNPTAAVAAARDVRNRALAAGIVETVPQSRFIEGIGLSFLTDFEGSREILEIAADEAARQGQSGIANRCMNGLATIYERIGDFGRAFQMLHKCLAIGRETGDTVAEIRALSNLGNIYAVMKDHDKAQELLLAAIELAKPHRDSLLWIIVCAAYAESLAASGRHVESEEQIKPCIELAERDGHTLHLGFLLKIHAENLMANDQLAETGLALARAEEIARAMKERDLVCDVLLRRAELALHQKDLAQAESILKEIAPLASEIGIPVYEMRAFGLEAQVAASQGRFDQAYWALSGELQLERALDADTSSRKTQMLKVEFEVEQHRIAAAAERDRNIQLDLANQKLKQALEQLEHTASHDPLTELLNRGKFKELAEASLRAAPERSEYCALCFIDLDEFKMVNDELGHDAGDTLLVEFSRRLKRTVRGCDLVARLGGDEFVVLIRELSDPSFVAEIVAKIRTALDEPVWLGRSWQAKASLGVAICPQDGVTLEDLQRHADRLMYQEKRANLHRSERT
jgi:diguanylate cyclase (GGDEF)-like protein